MTMEFICYVTVDEQHADMEILYDPDDVRVWIEETLKEGHDPNLMGILKWESGDCFRLHPVNVENTFSSPALED